MLSHLLAREGIDSVVLENRGREYVERRIRAGVLEHGAARLLRDSGVGQRLDREGLLHRGIYLQFEGERHHIDFVDLTGRGIFVYGQQEIVKDLIQARLAVGGKLLFEAEATRIGDFEHGDRPWVAYRQNGEDHRLECDFVAACDGSHGIGRATLLARGARTYEREYPHAWLGMLARTPPASDELIYAYHERGFALHSMRSPEVSRLYLQVAPDEQLAAWPEERIWDELRLRLAEPSLQAGDILETGITAPRRYVLGPMQARRLFLAGDAAHIVPPTGAKGMNLALADVASLAAGLRDRLLGGSPEGLGAYSRACSRRVWRAEYFSNFMTQLLHRDAEEDPFAHQLRLAQLRQLTTSRAAATALAENYIAAATETL